MSDTPEPAPLGPIQAAAATGDERATLLALRDHIAGQIDKGVMARDLASLSKRLIDIQRELDAIEHAEEGDLAEAIYSGGDEPL